MAEFVQYSIEEMLPELEQMERVELFTGKETRSILKKRKVFEYKLRRRTKQKEDFLQYIQYEVHVLSLLKKRRKFTGYNHKKVDIELPIINRIHKLFNLACLRFQDDAKLWLSHIEFCKKRSEKAPVGNLFTRMLQIHNKNPAIWVMSAQWEMEENLSMDNARGLLQRGLRFNPTSQHLWQEYFRMELLNADKLQKRRKILSLASLSKEEADVPDAVLHGKVASVVFKNAMETMPDNVSFCLSFMPICELFPFAESIEEEIFNFLQTNFPRNELRWEALALRAYQSAAQEDMKGLAKKEKNRKRLIHEKEAMKVFDQALGELNTEKLWGLYINFCLQRLQNKSPQKTCSKRVQRAADVFQRASDAEKLTADLYKEWVQLLLNTGQVEAVEHVLALAVAHHPQAVSLWRANLEYLICKGAESDTVQRVFQKALGKVSEKESYPLWQLCIEWSTVNCPEYSRKLFESGVNKCAEVGVPLKTCYLEWTGLHDDVKAVRNIYQSLSAVKPLSTEFFMKYIKIESSQPKPKIKRLRKTYEECLREYGSSSTDLWLDYIKLELDHSKGKPENAGQLHWRALNSLDGELTEEFITKYTLLQTGHL